MPHAIDSIECRSRIPLRIDCLKSKGVLARARLGARWENAWDLQWYHFLVRPRSSTTSVLVSLNGPLRGVLRKARRCSGGARQLGIPMLASNRRSDPLWVPQCIED